MIHYLRRIYRSRKFGPPVIVVSGLPRSGTSMAMKMLEAGGVQLFTDQMRKADEDNPKGYFEFERVKNLEKDPDKNWLRDSRGKAIKVISHLLKELPETCVYKVVFMHRNVDEVISSQNKMLLRRGEPVAEDDAQVKVLFEKHLQEVKNWLDERKNFEVLHVRYTGVLAEPQKESARIQEFLGIPLQIEAMVNAVDPTLYRNRRGE